MLKLVTKDKNAHQSILDEVLRQGAMKLLAATLEAEVEEYIQAHFEECDGDGRRLFVRNGKDCKRNLNSGAGQIEVEAPRINDKRPEHKFNSTILPPYLRKSPNIESLLPVLYLKGLSGNDFPRALESILGEGAKGLSSSTIEVLL